jgi:hypothetical protein
MCFGHGGLRWCWILELSNGQKVCYRSIAIDLFVGGKERGNGHREKEEAFEYSR